MSAIRKMTVLRELRAPGSAHRRSQAETCGVIPRTRKPWNLVEASHRYPRPPAAAKRITASDEGVIPIHPPSAIKTHFDGISLGHLLDLGASGRDNTADEATLRRWAVNFARHELTSYDGVRVFNAGSVGVHAAAEAVRTEVLNRIARQWPELASECGRQAQERKARHEMLIAMKS